MLGHAAVDTATHFRFLVVSVRTVVVSVAEGVGLDALAVVGTLDIAEPTQHTPGFDGHHGRQSQ